MKDVPPELLRAILGHRGDADSSSGVADLLVAQAETADVILLNKCDLVKESSMSGEEEEGSAPKKLMRLRQLVKALNPRTTTQVIESSFGRVPLTSILGVAKGEGVTVSGAVDDHREFVDAAEGISIGSTIESEPCCEDPDCPDNQAAAASSSAKKNDKAASLAASQVVSALNNDSCCEDPSCPDNPAAAASSTTENESAASLAASQVMSALNNDSC